MMTEVKVRVEDIPHMTDTQLKQALEKLGAQIGPITASTRHVHEQMLKRKLTGDAYSEDERCEVVEKAQKVFNEENTAAVEPSIYFGLFVPEGMEVLDNPEYQKVYTNKSACLVAVKKFRGSRFKAFRTHNEALHFAEAGPSVVSSGGGAAGEDSSTGTPSANAEKPSPFRGPKSQDLVKFRKAIEKDDFEFFCKCIEENPRYLVSGGDTPAVLQEGFRYNALHVACRTNKPRYVEKVLATVSHVAFFQKFYPDDSLETSARRSAYLTDLYLNTPDKGLNETPLHFASKHGAVECIRILMSYSACDKLRENKFGQKPIDIVCSRMKGSSDGVVDVIAGLLGDQWFVPLLRDDEHCLLPQVGQPWSPQLSSPSSPSPLASLSPVTVSPASPISPHLKELAADKGVGWREYWDFLGEFANMSSEEGMQKLELYLKSKFKRLMKEREELDASELTRRLAGEASAEECTTLSGNGSAVNVSGANECSSSTLGELCQELEALRLNTSLSPPQPNSAHLASASSKFLAFWKANEEVRQDEPDAGPRNEVEEEVAARQLMYIIKSTSVTAFRLAELMGELARDLQSNMVAKLSLPKTIRTKLKPEILCLRNVVGKCCMDKPVLELEYGFIHILLASKTVEHIQRNLMPCDISMLVETMKIFVSHLNFTQLDSSDEEGNMQIPDTTEKEINAQHFTCVLHCLEKALRIAYSSSNSTENLDLNRNDTKLNLMQLGECRCLWRKINTEDGCKSRNNTEDWSKLRSNTEDDYNLRNYTENDESKLCSQTKVPGSAGKYNKAFAFLHEMLFSGQKGSNEQKESNGERELSISPIQNDDSVVRHLLFCDDDDDDDSVVIKAKLKVKNGVSIAQEVLQGSGQDPETQGSGQDPEAEVQGNEQNTEDVEGSETDCDQDSFATAASSVEDDMLTPEEGVKVYINSGEASKVDVDVLTALGGKMVDANRYPHLYQWQQLISSYSEAERNSWASPYISRGRYPSCQSSTPSRLSCHTTPECPNPGPAMASTPHVLFPASFVHHDSPS